MENINCPICEIDNSVFFYDEEREGNAVNFVICKNCGLVYQNPRMNYKEFNEYYKKGFRKELKGKELDDYIDSRIEVGDSIFNILKENFLDKKNNNYENLSVLDVGCGVGGILHSFKQKNFKCKGIDTGSYLTEIGRNRLGIDIKEIFISEFNCDEKFDIIILCHSLEHFLEPVDYLKKIYSLLKDDGALYIEIPDIERPYEWTTLSFFFMLGHVFYYSPTTLNIMMNKCGFKDIFINSETIPFLRSIFIKKFDNNYYLDKNYYTEFIDKFEKLKKS